MNLCFKLMKTNRLMTLFFDRKLRSIGISAGQFYILSTISNESRNMSDYARWLGIERTTLTRNFEVLQNYRLIVRDQEYLLPEKRFILTESGQKTLEKCKQIMDNAHDELASKFYGNADFSTYVKLGECLEKLESIIGELNER